MSSRHKKGLFEKFSDRVTSLAGSPYGFSGAFLVILAWAASGPFFDFSETWQLVINTCTTIITFLMVFLIQKSQNKDSKAIQLKLNELIAADDRASNRMVDLEDLTEEELDRLHKYYEKLSALALKDEDIHTSHSIDAAEKVARIQKSKVSFSGKKGGATSKKKATSEYAEKSPLKSKTRDGSK